MGKERTRGEDILQEASRISSSARKKIKKIEIATERKEKLLVNQEAIRISKQIIENIETAIRQAAEKGETSINVMRVCGNRSRWVKEGVVMGDVYNRSTETSIAFGLVMTHCVKVGLKPHIYNEDTYDGENMPTIENIVVDWSNEAMKSK